MGVGGRTPTSHTEFIWWNINISGWFCLYFYTRVRWPDKHLQHPEIVQCLETHLPGKISLAGAYFIFPWMEHTITSFPWPWNFFFFFFCCKNSVVITLSVRLQVEHVTPYLYVLGHHSEVIELWKISWWVKNPLNSASWANCINSLCLSFPNSTYLIVLWSKLNEFILVKHFIHENGKKKWARINPCMTLIW